MENKKKDEQTPNTAPYDLQSYVNCKSDGVNKPVNAESVALLMLIQFDEKFGSTQNFV